MRPKSQRDAPHEEIHGPSTSRACGDDAASLRGKTPQDEITCRVGEQVAQEMMTRRIIKPRREL
jgi:hypothetical protein